MKKIIALVAALFLAATPLYSHAAEIKGGQSYKLLKGQVVEGNLYSGGGTVTIDGEVHGDVIATAGDVFVFGSVRDDLAAAGGTVQVTGAVGGDVRVAGGTVTLSGNVKGEVLVFGGTVNITSGAKIEKDVVVFGGTIAIDGEVLGMAKIRSGQTEINGTIHGDANVAAGTEDAVKIGATAIIGGNLNYTAEKEAQIADGAQIKGQTNFTQAEPHKRGHGKGHGALAFLSIFFLFKLISTLVFGLLMVWLAKPYLQEFVDRIHTGFGRETLRGFVIAIVLPVAMIIACVTLIGIAPAVVAGMLYMIMLILAKISAGIVFGSYLQKWMDKKTVRALDWKTVVGGIVAFMVLSLIPIVGWILGAAMVLAAFGGWWQLVYLRFRGNPVL